MKKKLLALFITVVATMAMAMTISASSDNPSMKITFLNVKHGDAAVIESNGHFMVIDGGKYEYVDTIMNYLKKSGTKKIDLVVSSHWDGDHVGGLNQVIRNYPVDTTWYSSYFVDNGLTQNVMKAIKINGCKAYTPKVGEKYQVGDATVEVIADGRNAKSVSTSKSKEVISNNSSLIVKVTCAGKSALFTGDARSEVEDKLPKAKVNCDILKAAHHGNFYSTSATFLKKVRPEYVAISVGPNNKEGAPNFHIVYNITELGGIISRTDKQGNLTYNVDKNGIKLTTQKQLPKLKSSMIKGIKKTYKYKGKKITPIPTIKIKGKKLYCLGNKTCYTTSTKTSCYHFNKNCKSLKGVKNKYKLKYTVAKCKTMKKRECGWCVKTPFDYKVTYKNNKKRGTATITVTGLGTTCTGTVTKTFKIK